MDYTLQQALDALNALTSTGDALKADLVALARKVAIDTQGADAGASRLLRHAPVRQHSSGRKDHGLCE